VEARRAAAAAHQASVELEMDEMSADARARASAIGRAAAERLPAFIDRVLATVLAADASGEGRTG
jgi:hypothetical protein